MAYIGTKPTIGNFQICDAISVVNGQAAYTMQVGGVNVSPQSSNHMIVSLNGTIQKPGSSFTVSGSTITFASNLATGDVIDFIQILGDVLDLGVPSDATVTAAKLNNDIISGTTALTSEPADTDEFLVSDAGTLKRIDYSLIKASPAMEQISQTTVSSAVASVSLTGMDSTYQTYKIIGNDITLASSDNYFFRFINSSGDITGSSYYGVGDGAYKPYNSSDANLRYSNYNSNYGRIQNFDPSTNATNASSFEMIIPNPSNTATYPYCYGSVGWSGGNGTYMITATFAFQYTSAGAITGLKFYGNGSVNTSTGTFTLYGLK